MDWREWEARAVRAFPDTREPERGEIDRAWEEALQEGARRAKERKYERSCEQDARTRRLLGTPMYYRRDGGPIWDMREWGQLHGEISYRRIGSETIGSYWISTVWLGLDHGWGWKGEGVNPRPAIFETMVFYEGADEQPQMDLDYLQERYPTEEEARRGHEEIVTTVRATVMTEDELLGGEDGKEGDGRAEKHD